MCNNLTKKEGFLDGFPIFLGYFSTAIAFGLVCRNINISLINTTLISMTSFAGSGQFLMVNLLSNGALLFELFISILLINLRYLFMGASLNQRLPSDITFLQKIIIAFSTTDEIFSVAILKPQQLNFKYLFSLELTSYSGWVLGTIAGYIIGIALPCKLQLALSITLYAMFASLLGNETRKGGYKILIVGFISAAINSFLITVVDLAIGWAFVIAMLSATIIGSFFINGENNE
ncbi:MAG: branched-chain amino acid ABC transporter permease [Spirochaetia bacterium]|nr:branched-chain amino acid ABC transporter permease [Spirochaetia bacterium]